MHPSRAPLDSPDRHRRAATLLPGVLRRERWGSPLRPARPERASPPASSCASSYRAERRQPSATALGPRPSKCLQSDSLPTHPLAGYPDSQRAVAHVSVYPDPSTTC